MELSIYLPESDTEASHLHLALGSSKSLEVGDINGFVKVLNELQSNYKLRYKIESYSENFGGKIHKMLTKCIIDNRIEEITSGIPVKNEVCMTKLIAYLYKIGVSQAEINANMQTYVAIKNKATATIKRNRKNLHNKPMVKSLQEQLKHNTTIAIEYLYLKRILANSDNDLNALGTFLQILSSPTKNV